MPQFTARSRSATDDLATVDWSERRVTVLGLGIHGGGVGAARFLAARGARVTISDSRPGRELEESIRQLNGLPIAEWRFGGHDRHDVCDAQFVVVNPAVRPSHPLLKTARFCGARLISEIELFLACTPARTIGVTGTTGKSTTAAMLAAMLEADGRRTWLGGNIGGSLLDALDCMSAKDWAVVELSSYQLAYLSPQARWPELAVVTNCSPHHLQWHGDFDSYRRAKQRLLSEQSPHGIVVLNALDPETSGWKNLAAGAARAAWSLDRIANLQVPGQHNRQNAACAAAAAAAVGVSQDTIGAALGRFRGLDHRLQFVAEVGGRSFLNDSKATSPSAMEAALEAVDGYLWLIVGGLSDAANCAAIAKAVGPQVRGVAAIGSSREMMRSAIADRHDELPLQACETLREAFEWCWRSSLPGDAVLLSPGCASHDQFRDFAERADVFCALVHELAARLSNGLSRSSAVE